MQVMTAQQDRFPLSRVFRIARGQRDSAQVITVNVEKNGVSGRGEGLPYARYGETPASVLAQIRALPNDIALEGLSQALPPGAAGLARSHRRDSTTQASAILLLLQKLQIPLLLLDSLNPRRDNM